MKLFKYNRFIKESKEDIDSICRKYGIRNYTINDDGTIDVDADVDLNINLGVDESLTKIPLYFNIVTGDFNCSYNELTSLEGCPKEVGGDFSCFNNNLINLKGGPELVGGNYYCANNKLISLKWAPRKIKTLHCVNNSIFNFDGGPNSINDLIANSNRITNLRELPYVKGHLCINDNPIGEILGLFDNDDKDIIDLLNEYNVIRDGKNVHFRSKIVYQSLELVYDDIGLEIPEFDIIAYCCGSYDII